KRAQLTLNPTSGEVVRWEPFSSFSRGRRLRSFLRFAHTGEVAGLIGQTVAGLASLGGAMLVWTGLALAWRRWCAWRAKRVASPIGG
ncbi:MAG: PepSY domain-containing protein, partial [Acidobacteriota bacterium]|nr:PepSY domain-containing protein [Acidobacteriota bacterium]